MHCSLKSLLWVDSLVVREVSSHYCIAFRDGFAVYHSNVLGGPE